MLKFTVVLILLAIWFGARADASKPRSKNRRWNVKSSVRVIASAAAESTSSSVGVPLSGEIAAIRRLNRQECAATSAQLYQCRDRCGDRFRFDERFERCKCDQQCASRQDCCFDYLKSCAKKSLRSLRRSNERRFFNALFAKSYTCLQPFGVGLLEAELKAHQSSKNYRTLLDGVLLISKCPKKFEDEQIKSRCETPYAGVDAWDYTSMSDFQARGVPVLGRDAHHYKNLACAQCHRVEPRAFWGALFDCPNPVASASDSDYISEFPKFRAEHACTLDPVVPSNHIVPDAQSMRCMTAMISQCSAKDATDEQEKLCQSYMNPYYIETTLKQANDSLATASQVYKNFHCFKCSSVVAEQLSTKNNECNYQQSPTLRSFGFSFSRLIQFSDGNSTSDYDL